MLRKSTSAVAAALHWPRNSGIVLRILRLPTQPETEVLAVFVHGLADRDLVRLWALEPLERLAGRHVHPGQMDPESVRQVLPAPQVRSVDRLSAAVRGVLEGATALFFDGAATALLVDTRGPVTRPVGSLVPENPYIETMSTDLADNVALLRKRLRDPALVAEPHDLPGERAGGAAVVYMADRADPAVVDQVRSWLLHRGGEESLRRGLFAGRSGLRGLLPTFVSNAWPDKVAALLDAGHVAPVGEVNPAKLVEGFILQAKQIHQVPTVRMHQFVSYLSAPGGDPFLPVAAVNPTVQPGSQVPAIIASGSSPPGALPRGGGNPAEFTGTAVFRRDRLMGYLNMDDTQMLLALRGQMGKVYFSLPDPTTPERKVTLRLHQENPPRYRATVRGGKPQAHHARYAGPADPVGG